MLDSLPYFYTITVPSIFLDSDTRSQNTAFCSICKIQSLLLCSSVLSASYNWKSDVAAVNVILELVFQCTHFLQ
jgi:hypothetical protein